MDTFSVSTFTALFFLISHFKLLIADPNFSFSFKSFDGSGTFGSDIALYGDAKAVGDGSSLQLTRSVSSSAGLVMYKKPIKFVAGNPRDLVSFSTNFSFSMSPVSGDGLAFVMVPSNFNVGVLDNGPFGLSLGSEKSNSKIVVVEFDTLRDAKYGDLNDNHVGIDVGGFVSVEARNVSSIDVVLKGGKRLQAWIDYKAGSKRLEVRLSRMGGRKPVDPFLSYPIDLSKMWNDGEMFVGLSSSNVNSSQTCFLHSWSFTLRLFPHWMHSQPLDPKAFTRNLKPVVGQKRSDCLLRMLAAMVFGTACGALGAFMVLYLWTIFGSRRPVVPEECSVLPVGFEYKKVKAVDKHVEDGKQ